MTDKKEELRVPDRAFLICVDSDGCAMDTMELKHIRCFGPCLVQEWGLEAWSDTLLARWNAINLYSMTRGVNRFKGLAMLQRLRRTSEACADCDSSAGRAETGLDGFEKSRQTCCADVLSSRGI